MAAKQQLDSRLAILKAAREAFIEGEGEFEIGQVAKRVGVSVGLS